MFPTGEWHIVAVLQCRAIATFAALSQIALHFNSLLVSELMRLIDERDVERGQQRMWIQFTIGESIDCTTTCSAQENCKHARARTRKITILTIYHTFIRFELHSVRIY